MPIEIVDVPLNSGVIQRVRVAYLMKGDKPGVFCYLQGLRTGALAAVSGGNPENTECASLYHANEKKFAGKLERELPGQTFDAILSPQSRYNTATAYRDAFIAASRALIDLTGRFWKDGAAKAGEEGVTPEQIFLEVKYRPRGDEPHLRSVLIVDDIFNSGKTVAAVIQRLVEAGVPPDCDFVAAFPFWAILKTEELCP
jgi:hypothetical protein